MKKRRMIFISGLFIIAIAMMITASIFRFSSNVSFFFNQEAKILVKKDRQWIQVVNAESGDALFKKFYEAEGINVSRLNFRRENRSGLQKMWEFFLPPKIMIFEFSPKYSFQLFAETDNNLNPINAQYALRKGNFYFVVNTSFYGSDHNIIGELVIDGESIGKDNGISSGFFKVVNGSPRVGPRSLFSNMHGAVSFSCQAHPSVMRNGRLFDYIISQNPPYHHTWKRKTYRNLIGEKENGNIVFVVSNRGALLSVKEISLIAQLMGVKNGSLFDGGATLQYKFRHNRKRITFSAFNNKLYAGKRIENFIHRKTGIQSIQKSPVYLGVKTTE